MCHRLGARALGHLGVGTLLLSTIATAAPGQRSAPPTRIERRLSLILELGRPIGGPGGGLASQFRRLGYDETLPGGCLPPFGCSGPIAHPTREGPSGVVGFAARLAIVSQLAIGAGYEKSLLGGAVGYNGSLGGIVISDWDATISWVAVFWRPSDAHRVGLHLGGGPGWYRLENQPMRLAVSRIGAMVEAAMELPADRRLFLYVAGRLHVIPAKDVDHQGVMLRPNWTHGAILAGLGLRL